MNPPVFNLKKWSADLKDWYDIDAPLAVMRQAYKMTFDGRIAHDGTSYEKMFICPNGKWANYLDTADREELAKFIEDIIKNEQ